MHWYSATGPVRLPVLRSVTLQWSTAVNSAINSWQVPVNTTARDVLELVPSSVTANNSVCNPVSGKILLCNAAYGQTGWLGIASVWTSNGHIVQATTKLNDTYFNTPTYNTPAWRTLVACQEIGHDFGLSHQDVNYTNINLGSCMDYTNSPGTNQKPNPHDFAQLSSIYGHGHLTTTTTTTTKSTAGADIGGRPEGSGPPDDVAGDSPSEWGRAIRFSADGRPTLFVRDSAPGRQKITHVFWAPDQVPPEAGH